MNGNDAKKLNGTINRHTGVSIGLIIALMGVVWWFATTNTRIEAAVESNTREVSTLNEDFMPRGELNQRLLNIEGGIERIEGYLLKK